MSDTANQETVKKDESKKELPATEGAHKIVLRNTYIAAGIGIIPIPLIDMVGAVALNLKMLKDLSDYYGLEFKQDLAKSGVTALVSGAASPLLAFGPISSILKVVPVVGSTLGALAGPVVIGATTYAVGTVFTLHFGSGGTFMDFDPEKFRDYFKEQFESGRRAVEQQLKKKESAPEPSSKA